MATSFPPEKQTVKPAETKDANPAKAQPVQSSTGAPLPPKPQPPKPGEPREVDKVQAEALARDPRFAETRIEPAGVRSTDRNPDGSLIIQPLVKGGPVVKKDGTVVNSNPEFLGTQVERVPSNQSMQRLYNAYQELQGAMQSKPIGLVKEEVDQVDGLTDTLVQLATKIRNQTTNVNFM